MSTIFRVLCALLLVIVGVWSSSVLAEVLELRNGQKIEGQFAGGSRDELHFQVGSQTLKFPVGEVARITFGTAAQEAFSKAAKEALRQIKALASVVEGGITYRDYAPRVSDAKIRVDQFLDEYKSSPVPAFNAYISHALGFYVAASSAWNVQISRRGYEELRVNSYAGQCAAFLKTVPNPFSGLALSSGKEIAAAGPQPLWYCARESLNEAEKALGQ